MRAAKHKVGTAVLGISIAKLVILVLAIDRGEELTCQRTSATVRVRNTLAVTGSCFCGGGCGWVLLRRCFGRFFDRDVLPRLRSSLCSCLEH